MSDKQAMKALAGSGVAGNLMSAGMDRLLQDESSDSYRVGFRILFGLVLIMSIAMVALTAGLLYTVKKGRTGDRFFAMSFDNKKMPLQGLSTPSLNAVAMLSWASQASTDIMTFGFNDINERMEASQKYFTEVGYESFMEAAHKAGFVKNILSKQQIMTAIPLGQPMILYEGLRKGMYVWDIQVPILLTVRAGSASLTARPELTITVVRVPTSINPSGFGIEQWLMF